MPDSALKDIWIPLMGVFVALAAFWIAWMQTSLTRRHNRLAVRPYLNVTVHFEDSLRVKLTNCGLGPAIVSSLQIFGRTHDNKEIELQSDDANVFFEAIGLNVVGVAWNIPTQKDVIPVGTAIILFEIPITKGELDRLSDSMRAVRVFCNYQSFYLEEVETLSLRLATIL